MPDLVVAEDIALLEQGVHQRGLAVIDVRNNGNVSDVLAGNPLSI